MKSQPDFASALTIVRRMMHLPTGVEDGATTGSKAEYKPASPNGKPHDERGVKWANSPALEADPKSISLLLKIALGRGWREVEQAINIFRYVQDDLSPLNVKETRSRVESGVGSKRQWDLELAKDVERACERLLEREWPEEKAAEYKRLGQKAKRLQQD